MSETPRTDALNVTVKATPTLKGDVEIETVFPGMAEIRDSLTRQILKASEKVTGEALIALGWTPPPWHPAAPPPVQGAGEPVAWMHETLGNLLSDADVKKFRVEYADKGAPIHGFTIPLYTTPPVPNAVREALERFARLHVHRHGHGKQDIFLRHQDVMLCVAAAIASLSPNTKEPGQ